MLSLFFLTTLVSLIVTANIFGNLYMTGTNSVQSAYGGTGNEGEGEGQVNSPGLSDSNTENTNTNTNTNASGLSSNYSGIEQQTKSFLLDLQAKNSPPINTLPPSEARAALSGLQSSYPATIPQAQVENMTIPVGPDGEQISINIIRPMAMEGQQALPVVMYFHGGGWVLGGYDTHERLVKELANEANATIVFVNYTRSPEAKYPVSLEEAYAATQWIADNGQSINVDSSRMAVAGDSAGGNMATAVALLAKERGGPAISFQALFYPVTDFNFDTDSYMKYQNGYHLTRDAMMWFWDNYLDNQTADPNDPLVSPLRASIEQLTGLPPTLIITAENDVLRDEGEAYAHKLMDAGVPVASIRYFGTIHDFMILNALANTPATQEAISQAASIIGKVLNNVN